MGGMWIVLGVVVVVLLVVVVWPIAIYNSLVALRTRIDNAWSQIDVQLNRRHDLIPNLVETVKGYASHERDTFEAVISARNTAVAAHSPAEAAQAENAITGALSKLFALSEAYPDLKADANFRQLQEELTATEDRIAYARQFYNDQVRAYNTKIAQFPAVLVANAAKFAPREFFEVDPGAREVPRVEF
jgi:LemA protein